jgi:hypothetical protein
MKLISEIVEMIKIKKLEKLRKRNLTIAMRSENENMRCRHVSRNNQAKITIWRIKARQCAVKRPESDAAWVTEIMVKRLRIDYPSAEMNNDDEQHSRVK